MGTPLQSILQARYQNPADIGSTTYGGEETGSDCLDINKIENTAGFTNTTDVSRTAILYFHPDLYLNGNGEGLPSPETGGENKQAINRALNFLNKPYVLMGSGVYVYDKGTQTWSPSLELTGKSASESVSIGLYPYVEDGVPYMVTAWKTTPTTSWRWAKFNGETEQWTKSSAIALGVNISDTNGAILNEIQHKDTIYFIGSSNTTVYYLNYRTGFEGFGSFTWDQTVRHPIDFTTFNGRLYALTKDATASPNTRHQLIRINAGQGSTTLIETIGEEPISNTDNFIGRNCLFVDNVYSNDALAGHGGIDGSPVMWGFATAVGPLDDSVQDGHFSRGWVELPNGSLSGLPDNLGASFPANPFKMMINQQGAAGGPFPKDAEKTEHSVLRIFVDQKNRDLDVSDKTNISCAARYSVGCDSNNTGGGDLTNLHYFQWKGTNDGEAPTTRGGKHSFQFLGFPGKQVYHRSFAHEKRGGGGRYWEVDGADQTIPDIRFIKLTPTTQNGIVRIHYSLSTSEAYASGTNVNVRWFFDKNLHAPETQCTIVGASEGSISGTYIVTGIPLEDKEYWADWDARGDNASRTTRHTFAGQVATALSSTQAIGSPADLPSLAFWLEANDETTITSGVGGKISEWRDKSSGSVSGLTQNGPAFQPVFIPNANNGNGGVSFDSAHSQYLFSSGSPVDAGAITALVVYEPTGVISRQTMVSMSNDNIFTWGVTDFTDANHLTIFASGNEKAIAVETQDWFHAKDSGPARELTIVSGVTPFKTYVATSRDLQFEASLEYATSGDASLGARNEIFASDQTENYEPSGLSNITLGRFSGSSLSGIYTSAGNYFDGIIYEVAIYDRSLYDIEIQRFERYVQLKYQLGF